MKWRILMRLRKAKKSNERARDYVRTSSRLGVRGREDK